MTRPRGYLGVDDTVLFNGARPAFSNDPVPNVSKLTLRRAFGPASHLARFRSESIGLRNPPAGHVAVAEFSY